jgi:4-hydroxy-tetrahydrodipicolinate synthase
VFTLAGAWTALVTPFSRGGDEVDFQSLENLIERQIAAGISGLVPCGSTGEGVALSDAEYQAVVSFVVRQARGRVPVMAGAGASATARTIELAQWAEKAGADAVMVVAPPYNKPSQGGLLAHYRAVKAACGLPLVPYNIPGRSVVSISAETLATLWSEGTIAGVKDSSASISFALEVIELTQQKLPLVSGEDGLIHPLMACGGQGVVSVISNLLPERVCELVRAAAQHKWALSLEAQVRLLPWVKAEFHETNPIPIKAALADQGLIANSTVRLPLTDAQPATRALFRRLLDQGL